MTSPIGRPRTLGDNLPALIVKRERLKADLRDTKAAYREKIKEIDEQVKEAAFNADQIVMAFADSTPSDDQEGINAHPE